MEHDLTSDTRYVSNFKFSHFFFRHVDSNNMADIKLTQERHRKTIVKVKEELIHG